MTISSTDNRKEYTGNGVTTAFSFPYYFLADADLKVYQNGTLKTITTHYTVTGAGVEAGGTVTFVTAPANDDDIIIVRDPAITQTTDYPTNDPFPAAAHERALDKLTMIVQRLDDRLDRAAVLPDTVASTVDPALPTPSAGKALLWNATADGLENSTDDFNDIVTDAATQATAAAASATAAAASATAASTAQTAAELAETNAETAETNAEAAAAAAQAAADSIGFRDVIFLTVADSPYTVAQATSGKLLSVDSSGGAVTVNLPTIATLTLPFTVGIKKATGDANAVTINRGGTDTFDDGSTSLSLTSIGGTTLIPDTDTAPDKWSSSSWGALAGQQKKQQFTDGVGFTAGVSTTITLTETPLPTTKDVLTIWFDGSYQQESEWEIAVSTGIITFDVAIPGGTAKIECVWTTPLATGTPADGTVTEAKLANGAVTDAKVEGTSNLYNRITDIRSAIDYMTSAEAADVRTNAGAVDVTAAIQAAIDAAEAAGGGIVYCPAGKYKTTAKLTIQTSGVFLVGDGPKATLFAPNFDTDPFIEFDSASLLERVGIFDCEIAHSISRTAGATIKFGRGYRMYAQDIETTSSYIGITVGDNADPAETVDCRIIRARFNTSNDGAVVTAQAGIFFQGCKFNGVAGNSSTGVKITGSADGVWLDDTTTIEEHDTSFRIEHSSGSVANIYINGTAFDRPRVAGFRINISGTASINGVYVDGLKIFDTVGAGDSDGILVASTSSGAINDLEFRNVSGRDMRQRFANVNAVVDGLVFHGCVSRRGSLKSAGTYAGIELNSLAHTHVVITGCEVNGSHNYGLQNAINSTNIVVTGNDFSGNSTGGWTNLGASSATRQFNGNIGTSGNPANTFTPTIVSSGGGTPTYTTQYGTYEIINGRVFFNLSVTLATLGTLAAGNVTIAGLPVASRNATGATSAQAIRADTLAASATTALMAAIGVNSSVITPARFTAGARTNLTVADLAGTTTFEVSGSYPI